MPTQSARSRSRSRGCDRSKSSQTLTLLQVTTLNTARHSTAQRSVPSHPTVTSQQWPVVTSYQLPVASHGNEWVVKKVSTNDIACAQSVRQQHPKEWEWWKVMKEWTGQRGRECGGWGSRGNVRGKVSRQRQHENYRLRCRVASGADADARLPREISQ